ncbi:MAG: hypothetical protein AB1744_12900 [Candidatus Zixiibacteriota bacterium]
MTESFFKQEGREPASSEIPQLDEKQEKSEDRSEAEVPSFGTEEGRLGAILSYIPFLCFVPLLSMKDNPEIRLHARQGVILFLIELVAALFLVDRIADFVFTALLIAAIILAIVGIYFAAQGKSYRLPIIGDIADKTKL